MKVPFLLWAVACAALAGSMPVGAQPKSGLRLPETLDRTVSEKRARERIQQILSSQPEKAATNSATLQIRSPGGDWTEIPLLIKVVPGPTNWLGIYEASPCPALNGGVRLTIQYTPGLPNAYFLRQPLGGKPATGVESEPGYGVTPADPMIAFAGSDFWLADLGLEFFHWPAQRFLRNEIRRGQSCDVIESLNPNPTPGTYARVVTWIDVDTGGIVLAEAYDRAGPLMKRFAPKSFEKVNGQWQLQEMEIRNLKAGTRTRIEFKFD